MQKCKKCGKEKGTEDFYLSNKSACKECLRRRTILWQRNNPGRFEKYCGNQRDNPKYRKKQAEFYREWYAKCGRNRAKNYVEAALLWKKLNPEKCKASKLVTIALKLGKLKKPKHCSNCEIERKLVAHHDNYEFPLRVRWLCYSCHQKLHIRRKIKIN